MNFVFISPNFPHTYWQFCACLRGNGVNVLGVGDAPYDALEAPLKSALTEYYRVDSLEDYDQVYRAVAFFAFKYGRIDWIESMNEYWLEQDARLRVDFNVTTGIQTDRIGFIKEKSLMKQLYVKAGIPTARQSVVSTREAAHAFIDEVGYPVIVKPDVGVGATNTWKLENDADLDAFFDELPEHPYVMEEFIEGIICSYDAITNSKCEPLFESMTVWPPVMDIVNKDLDLMYYTCPEVPEGLRTLGRKTVKAFGVDRRFVHLEFFRLTKGRKGLGKKGDFAALEVNMRPAGGLRGHGHLRQPQRAGGPGAQLLRLRQPQGRAQLHAHPRGDHGALRRGYGHAGGNAADELAADGALHVHGAAEDLRGRRGVHPLRTELRALIQKEGGSRV